MQLDDKKDSSHQKRGKTDESLGKIKEADDQIVSPFARERQQADETIQAERNRSNAAIKSLENEQLAHGKTKMSLLSREDLLAIVSHDLRNPIGAISSCASMLLDGHGGEEIPSATRTWIEFMKRNADAALRLTNDLLDVERAVAGKLQLQLSQHDFVELMKKVTENFVSTAAAKSILLRTIPPTGTFIVTCDGERIGQVLANLVGNAIKFTSERGSITLQLRADDHDYIRVSVRDTGPGIPDDKKSEIFERYAQLDKKEGSKSWGLGLYISKKIVEAHHGKLWVDSKVGEGSTFTFTIPR